MKYALILFLFPICVILFSQGNSKAETRVLSDDDPIVIALRNGTSMDPNKQKFEYSILNLLLIVTDDVYRGLGLKKLDMDNRKVNFSDKGWLDYENYVDDYKELLIENIESRDYLGSKADFLYESQRYNKGKGFSEFCAVGTNKFSLGHASSWPANKFRLRIHYFDIDNKIDKWNVELFELNDDSIDMNSCDT